MKPGAVFFSEELCSRDIFEIFHAVMAILVPFEQFSGKFCLNFLTLNLSSLQYFTKYDAFCSQVFNYACLRRKGYCCRRGTKL